METLLALMEGWKGMVLSAAAPLFDWITFLVFMGSFGTRRFPQSVDKGIACLCGLLVWGWYGSSGVLFAEQAAPFGMLAGFVLFYALSWILFAELTFLYRFFLVLLWDLGRYLYAAVLLFAFSALCDLPYPLPRVWREASGQGWFLFIYGGFELVAALCLRQLLRRQDRLHLHPRQLVLYFAFPAASFVSLLAFLPMLSGRPVNQWLIGGCCIALLLANLAVLFLLRRMEQAVRDRERLAALDEQFQMQSRNMEATRELYEVQRKATHDFGSQLEVLGQLLQHQEYDAARDYLKSVSDRRLEYQALVDCRHPALNALFNTRAKTAQAKGIEIRFEVNDLSGLPFQQADLTVLMANLLDNAIQASEKSPQPCAIEVRALREEGFFFSVRNTSLPIAVENGCICTTKNDAKLHGFGLLNVKSIVEKYKGIWLMQYEAGWFQFTGEIPLL